MAKINEIGPVFFNKIEAGTIVKGEIISNGDIRIDGTLIGSIKSQGKLIVGEKGKIEGEINCQRADFEGDIKGQVQVGELLSLKATCKFEGEVTTAKLAVEPGATFNGTCVMNKDKAAKHGEKIEENFKKAAS